MPKQELDYFLKKTREDAFRVLDLKIIDGQKRIDLIKYKTAEVGLYPCIPKTIKPYTIPYTATGQF